MTAPGIEIRSIVLTDGTRTVYAPHMQDRRETIAYIDLGVGGMTCDDCVVHVTAALESVPGVGRVTVDFATRKAVVEADPEVRGADLSAAVRATGEYNAFERRRRTA